MQHDDPRDLPTPEQLEMQNMIATNQREIDTKVKRIGEERLAFLQTRGNLNWKPEGVKQDTTIQGQ